MENDKFQQLIKDHPKEWARFLSNENRELYIESVKMKFELRLSKKNILKEELVY